MATFDFASLAEPLSEDAPCGPDLDLEGDPDFANFVARAEGVFPASFYTRDSEGNLQVFDRTTIDFAGEFKVLDRLLGDTRDLRLLTIYGRLLALNRDLPGFAACIDAVAGLIKDRWADVNPKGEDGDYSLRGAVLQALDDNPTVVLPLQNIPLVLSRRAGAISYRSIMVANGEVKARDDEASIDRGTVDRAFAEAELDDLRATAGHIRRIVDATATIQVTSIENAGYDQAVSLEKLPPLATKMLAAVEGAVAARDPSAAVSATEGAADAGGPGGSAAGAHAPVVMSGIPAGRIASTDDAREALAALNGYFRTSEPSSPAAILVQQAQRLMGKSLPEVVRLLLPVHADSARIQLGAEKLFGLGFEQFPDPQEAWGSAAAAEPAASAGDDGWGSSWSTDETTATAATPAEEGAAPAADVAVPAKPAIEARTRADAASLLDQVTAFYRAAEPSSPIPLLTERARGLLERDFITILKDILPDLVPRPDE